MESFRCISLSDRISETKLYMKLYNHNAWTKHPLDIDSLGAGGGMGEHLIFFGTQNQLGTLMTKSQLWDLISAIGTYEYKTGQQTENKNKAWDEEYKRLDKGGKLNASFTYDLAKKGLKPTINDPVGVIEN